MSGHRDNCGAGHCHHGEINKKEIIHLSIAAFLLLLSFIPLSFIAAFPRDVLRIICAAICIYPVIESALDGIYERKVGEHLLLVIAVFAAAFIREFAEAAAVSLFFRIGEFLEDYAGSRSKKSIEEIYSIVSDEAHIVRESGGFEEIDADNIRVGMKLAVLPHETVPVDGIVTFGSGQVDASAITGESMPVEMMPGSKLLSGMVNGTETLFYEATEEKQNSAAARIAALVEEAASEKSKAQGYVSKFARYYTPAVIAVSVLIAVIPSLIRGEPSVWIHRALVLLVASCPCAVVLSVPLAFLSSIGNCAKNGMIIKGSNIIESLSVADTVVFDKTGTLTDSISLVGEIYASEGYDEQQILEYAAKCEYHSSHPVAVSVIDAFGEPDMTDTFGFSEIPGGGTSINVPEGKLLCGGKRLMESQGIDISALPELPVYVSLSGEAIGGLTLVNKPRESAYKAISDLKSIGINNIVMLTGDTYARAENVANELHIDSFEADLTPEKKLTALEKIKSGSKGVIYVGDGINDTPSLARADVGIAMGLGTKSAGEAADVILTDSELTKLGDTIKSGRKTINVLNQNIGISLIAKLLVIIPGIIGVAPIWLAVLADVGTMIICVINSARLMKAS